MVDPADIRSRFTDSLKALYSESEIGQLWRIFFQSITGNSPLFYRGGDKFTSEQKGQLERALSRLGNGEPYQYVLGKVPFANLELVVRPGVLIPRPETEELIDLICSEGDLQSVQSVLDIGTGSGCIALSLAKCFPSARVTALDKSENALAVAAENARRNNLDIQIQKHDILDDRLALLPSVDLIVSNPPYIARSEADEMSSTVKNHEPAEALFVDDEDPLIFYRRIEEVAAQILNTDGRIYLELNASYARECLSLFANRNWQARLIEDMSGNERFLKVWK